MLSFREHRKFFAKILKDTKRELDSMRMTLELDSKNYHCWVYRKWLCETFDMYESEMVEVEKYLDNDVYNNSAWSYRFFLYNRGKHQLFTDDKAISAEIEYVSKRLQSEENNESAWNYLNG